jgi:hypothetical protein
MASRSILLALLLITALMSAPVVADIGVFYQGQSGTAVIHVADAVLRATSGGAETNCAMPSDNTSYPVSRDANRVEMIGHYHFSNQKAQSQVFAVGYKVWDSSGRLVRDSGSAVQETVRPNGQQAGDFRIGVLDVASSGSAYRISVRCEVQSAKESQTTRTVKVIPRLD